MGFWNKASGIRDSEEVDVPVKAKPKLSQVSMIFAWVENEWFGL
jgi:hypothetical protein